jgi:hypothetical protein
MNYSDYWGNKMASNRRRLISDEGNKKKVFL